MPQRIIAYTKEQERFINEIIYPVLTGSTEKDIVAITYDFNGKIIHVTDAYARMFGHYDKDDIYGKDISKIRGLRDNKLINKLNNIRRKVVKTEIPAHYIVFAYYSYGFDAHFVYNYPIFMEDGSVIASRAISKKFTLFNPLTIFNSFFVKSINRKRKVIPNAELSPLEYRILFLLHVGLRQHEMASLVEVSRSRLGQILMELYTKFKVSDQKALSKFIEESNLITTIPEELIEPKVILLDNSSSRKFVQDFF